jgi:hypothetical protein
MGGSFYYFHEQDQKILPKYSISLDFKDNSSFNASYPIILSGVPSGSGTYQQLITLNNYSKYGINSQGSNLAFYDSSNLTHLYAWIQSINATSMQVWVKNYNGSSAIDMRVLPFNKNLFNATGYLGEASAINPLYDNFNLVAKNGQITVNNKSFITEDFSNYLTNLTFSNLSASNNTISSLSFSYTNFSKIINGFASYQLTRKNYTILDWQRNFNTGIYWINASMFEDFLNENDNNIVISTTKNPVFNNLGEQTEGYYSLLTGHFNSTTIMDGAYNYYYNTSNQINYNNDTIISHVHFWNGYNGIWSNTTSFISLNPLYWNFKMLYIMSAGGYQNEQIPRFNITYNGLYLIKSKTTN